MNDNEKFQFDLEGYLVVENVLDEGELASLNALVDEHIKGWDNDPSNDYHKCSHWGQATTDLIDYPRILPYLVELLGPTVRIDHDYAIIMDRGESRGGLHGGPSLGGNHYFRYHDGAMRNGLDLPLYNVPSPKVRIWDVERGALWPGNGTQLNRLSAISDRRRS